MQLELSLANEEQTVRFGKTIGQLLTLPLTIHLYGDLGAGKTTFSRGVLRSLGHEGPVKSPTFTLVEPYDFDGGQVFHFDLYRLADPDELEYVGVDDYFGEKSLCLVEWPEKAEGVLPGSDLDVYLYHAGQGRSVRTIARSEAGRSIVKSLDKWESENVE